MTKWAAVAVVVPLLMAGCGGASNDAASCVAPGVVVSPHSVAAGASVRVAGKAFLASCGDTSANGTQAKSKGENSVKILLTRDGESTTLGTARPDKKTGDFSSTVTIPSTMAAGDAKITTDEPTGYGDSIVITK